MELSKFYFKEISRESAKDTLMNKHYLKRMPPLSYAFGAYYDGKLKGVMTFGKPPSNALCVGVCGEDYSKNVIELNRLYTDDDTPRNLESMFISYALKELKKVGKFIIISYADEGMNHCGYIYQATNWIYTGLLAKRTDVYVGENGHSRTYTQEQKEFPVRKIRSMKHRYIYIVGSKSFKNGVIRSIKYPIINEYPKSEVKHYTVGEGMDNTLYNKHTGATFKECDFINNPLDYITDDEYKKYLAIYTK